MLSNIPLHISYFFIAECGEFKEVSERVSSFANNMDQIIRDQVETKQKNQKLETEKKQNNNEVRDLKGRLETAVTEKNSAIRDKKTAETELADVVKERDAAIKRNSGLVSQG